ncbi:hypothetical protein MAGR_56210 [Mycolicibacterium agri]|uniref:Uncharacterized protein n=1 Tax=Mycolicibacterium agri TaxID=36811 RepID=A0A7I9W9B4_MYCAG|nr:hypothetical protein MAGR_56210 [Mycolicibacterium agri]
MPVGAIRALDGFDILTGDQGQQRHRLGRAPQILLRQMPQQSVRVADQSVDQQVAGVLVVPGDRLTRIVVIVGGAMLFDHRRGGGTSRRTRRIAAIN